MFARFKFVLALTSLVLIGAGCRSSAPVPDLPMAPPAMEKKEDGNMMGDTQKSATATMMQKGQQGDAMKSATGSMAQSKQKPYYIAYSTTQAANALKEGRAVVYYFWAGWCPICKAEEPKLKTWIENSDLPIAGFRVNYDTETELKAKYKINYQHTTVFLNAKGVEVERFYGPVEEATFIDALKKATQ